MSKTVNQIVAEYLRSNGYDGLVAAFNSLTVQPSPVSLILIRSSSAIHSSIVIPISPLLDGPMSTPCGGYKVPQIPLSELYGRIPGQLANVVVNPFLCFSVHLSPIQHNEPLCSDIAGD
jgi:hypothetical protein